MFTILEPLLQLLQVLRPPWPAEGLSFYFNEFSIVLDYFLPYTLLGCVCYFLSKSF